jgi:FkbM family methyltransferase
VLTWYRRVRRERLPGALGDWYRDGGNDRLVIGLPIRSSDTVVDIGGYVGDWAAAIAWRYGSSLVILEPVLDHYNLLRRKFERNERVRIVRAAASDHSGTATIQLAADSSSLFTPGGQGQSETVPLLAVQELFEQLPDKIACMKLNIEGAEYEVMGAMLAAGLASKVDCFLIQFHDFDGNGPSQRHRILDQLRETHRSVFSYEFVWERWDLQGIT